jgi:hypothetical protein
LVNNIEKLVIKVYFYLSQFGKKVLELERVDILLDVKALKIF